MIRSFFICLGFLLTCSAGMAHGINFETTKHPPAVTVKAFFSRTSPVANAQVTIFSPGDDQAYQSGRTDKAGYFAFIPSLPGDWVLIVDDERGHVDRVIVPVADSFFDAGATDLGIAGIEQMQALVQKDESEAGIPLFFRIVVGLALIFGLTGVIYGYKAKLALKTRN
jgi:nickel transport protein